VVEILDASTAEALQIVLTGCEIRKNVANPEHTGQYQLPPAALDLHQLMWVSAIVAGSRN
jgi:hypothetical protein